MFERFTERARNVMVLAQEEARRFDHNYIGTEHLLLGLIREDEGVAAQALGSVDVSLDRAREQVENIVGCGEVSREENGGVLRRLRERIFRSRIGGYDEERTGGQAPFTPRSKKTLELALREAMQLGHDYIGTEHILLGLVRESEGVAAMSLRNLRVNPDHIRREVVRRLGEPPESDSLDLVEAQMEAEEVGRWRAERRTEGRVFQGFVSGVRVETSSMGTFTVNLDYTYAVGDAADSSETIEHAKLVSCVRNVFADQELSTVEDGIRAVGVTLLSRSPKLREITVNVAWCPDAGESVDYEATTSATFRR